MPTPASDLLAQTILTKEKRRAQAKAVLARPTSAGPVLIAVPFLIGMTTLSLSTGQFDAPLWVKGMLATGFIVSVLNTLESWTLRRRLDAAITLLQLDQE